MRHVRQLRGRLVARRASRAARRSSTWRRLVSNCVTGGYMTPLLSSRSRSTTVAVPFRVSHRQFCRIALPTPPSRRSRLRMLTARETTWLRRGCAWGAWMDRGGPSIAAACTPYRFRLDALRPDALGARSRRAGQATVGGFVPGRVRLVSAVNVRDPRGEQLADLFRRPGRVPNGSASMSSGAAATSSEPAAVEHREALERRLVALAAVANHDRPFEVGPWRARAVARTKRLRGASSDNRPAVPAPMTMKS